MLILLEVFPFSLMLLVSLVILLVIFVLFVLANMMLRPELFVPMNLSNLLRMVLIFLNQKRRKMIENVRCFIKRFFSHFSNGCSICSSFARHLAKTVVQILKGGNFHKES